MPDFAYAIFCSDPDRDLRRNVEDQESDVVWSAATEGQVDEFAAGIRGRTGPNDPGDFLVAYKAPQPIGA